MPAALSADCAFIIGQSHQNTAQPCQDYALAGSSGEQGWAIVSDGCSTGGRTDIGSRMWSQAAVQLLGLEGAAALLDAAHCAQRLQELAQPLLAPFAFEDGYATLLMAATDEHAVRLQVFGDGVVMARYRDGRLKTWNLEYSLNAPRYLNDDRRIECRQKWLDLFGQETLRVVVNEYDRAGAQLEVAVQESVAAEQAGFALELARAGLEAVFLCTDGAVSFEGQGHFDSLAPLTQVKNPSGQFMQRRMGALLRQWRKDNNKGPTDDLAVACLWLGDEA